MKKFNISKQIIKAAIIANLRTLFNFLELIREIIGKNEETIFFENLKGLNPRKQIIHIPVLSSGLLGHMTRENELKFPKEDTVASRKPVSLG